MTNLKNKGIDTAKYNGYILELYNNAIANARLVGKGKGSNKFVNPLAGVPIQDVSINNVDGLKPLESSVTSNLNDIAKMKDSFFEGNPYRSEIDYSSASLKKAYDAYKNALESGDEKAIIKAKKDLVMSVNSFNKTKQEVYSHAKLEPISRKSKWTQVNNNVEQYLNTLYFKISDPKMKDNIFNIKTAIHNGYINNIKPPDELFPKSHSLHIYMDTGSLKSLVSLYYVTNNGKDKEFLDKVKNMDNSSDIINYVKNNKIFKPLIGKSYFDGKTTLDPSKLLDTYNTYFEQSDATINKSRGAIKTKPLDINKRLDNIKTSKYQVPVINLKGVKEDVFKEHPELKVVVAQKILGTKEMNNLLSKVSIGNMTSDTAKSIFTKAYKNNPTALKILQPYFNEAINKANTTSTLITKAKSYGVTEHEGNTYYINTKPDINSNKDKKTEFILKLAHQYYPDLDPKSTLENMSDTDKTILYRNFIAKLKSIKPSKKGIMYGDKIPINSYTMSKITKIVLGLTKDLNTNK